MDSGVYLIYTLILLFYIPGIVGICLSEKIKSHPLLMSIFFGMLFFSAIGSYGVISENKIYELNFSTSNVAFEFAMLIIVQVVVFYIIAGVYISFSKPRKVNYKCGRVDYILVVFGLLAIIIIDALYFYETGTFLLIEAYNGEYKADTALDFREKYLYGLKNLVVYNLGFFFLPIYISSYSLIILLTNQGNKIFYLLAIAVCVISNVLLGSKSGILIFLMSLTAAAISYFSATGLYARLKFAFSVKYILLITFSMVVLYVGYNSAFDRELKLSEFVTQVYYRVFVAYPETTAAAIGITKDFGFLSYSFLPTLRGIFSHDQLIISTELHTYLSGEPGGLCIPFVAELYLISGWSSVFLFLPMIFIGLIVLENFIFSMSDRCIAASFFAVCSYLSINLSINGLFSSFVNLPYFGVLLIFYLLYFLFNKFLPRKI